MIRPVFRFSFLCVLLLSSCTSKTTINAGSADIVVCGDDKVLLLNSRKSATAPAVSWRWKVSDAQGLPPAYQKWMVPLDDCKPVMNRSRLLLTSSGGGVVLLDIKTQKPVFYARVPMAHSAEILPGNRVVVALSTHPQGNSIELYDLDKPEQRLFRDSLYSGHGVVWSPKYQRLFALGFGELRAYALQDWNSAAPRLRLEQKWRLPSEGGHDLSAMDPETLIVTTHHNVFTFAIPEARFKVFEPLKERQNIKSANYDPHKKQLLFTQAEESWWTYHIYMRNPDRTITIPDIKLYKTRFF
ncbi:DUF6528 family protein [Niabella drilacis]|uniref:WD40-like Beta Propeller Repeat n=1 Tax=Niabella drilacis (strain DSM 25811 / CCM 8410 / CCUG 62505 / LMG 26954 / E90) TaxID=1285928 RepID=A0A1G7ANI5_NIADE|nr:DUF6528 family protein [Niabella drilacis]SDE16027.1 hypothetical protein SAMN04487894_12425 [Niabella drilacis]